MSLLETVERLGLMEPIGVLVDPGEAIRFIEYLPQLEWHQAYVAMLLIRSKGLKEQYGFKGTDHSLEIRIVPGYHRDPRFRLYLLIRRFAVLAQFSDQYYIYERHTKDGVEIYRIPQPLVAIMVSPNPSDWVRASVDTVMEFLDSLRQAMLNPERASEFVRRLDVRLGANAMRRSKHMFHVIDIDDRALIPEIETAVQEILGYMPARIETKRGEHILVKVSELTGERARRWFQTIPKMVEEINRRLNAEPPVVEYKKNFQEPVPGTKYRDYVPRFRPPER